MIIFYQLWFVEETCPIGPPSPETGDSLFLCRQGESLFLYRQGETWFFCRQGESLFLCRQGESRTDQVACSDPGACASRGGHGQDCSEANSEHQRLASIQGGRHSLCCHWCFLHATHSLLCAAEAIHALSFALHATHAHSCALLRQDTETLAFESSQWCYARAVNVSVWDSTGSKAGIVITKHCLGSTALERAALSYQTLHDKLELY